MAVGKKRLDSEVERSGLDGRYRGRELVLSKDKWIEPLFDLEICDETDEEMERCSTAVLYLSTSQMLRLSAKPDRHN